jgi:hypothetical protein
MSLHLTKYHYILSTVLIVGAVTLGTISISNPVGVSLSGGSISGETKSFVGVSLFEGSDSAVNKTSDKSDVTSSELLNAEVKIPPALETYIYGKPEKVTFGGGNIVYPKTNIAIQRAFGSVGDALSVCMDGRCFNKCDHLAGDIWGYEDASGYLSAKTHWDTAVNQGIAVFDDREPPLGALLFWETGRPFGHVATYIGNGMVVTNAGGEYGSNVYIYYADWYDKVGYKYLGWAPPVFFNEEPGSAL